MARKIGRNEPCPCGSGKKYKRCCLAADEEAARQAALLASVDDWDDELDEEWDLDELDRPLQRETITSLCYTRGQASTIAEIRAGKGLTITEWTAPRIPRAVFDAL